MGTEPQPESQPSAVSANARAWGFWVLGTMSVLLVLVAGATGYLWRVSGTSPIGGPFTLINPEGKPATDGDFRGKYLLVYFGYTFCPDGCPTTLSKMVAAIDKLCSVADT